MRSLLRVEATRLRWRRAIVLLLVAAVAVPALIFAATAWNTRPVSEGERDQILSERYAAKEVRRCERDPANFLYPEPNSQDAEVVTAACEAQILDWYGGRSTLLLDQEVRAGSVLGVVAVVGLLMLLVGTTFVGHDWNSGSMSNQLLFEPRRSRVWAAKALVVLATGTLVAGLVLAAYWTGLWVLAGSRGLPTGGGVVGDGFELVLRSAVLAGAAALGGYALTMLFRSTVATIGVLFAVSVVGGTLIGLLNSGGPDSSQRWQPQTHLAGWVTNEARYYDESSLPEECLSGRRVRGVDCDGEQVVTAADAGAYLGLLLLGAGAVSLVSYRRRDVP
ncbi:ABC-2 family transporter protein [Nocardioides dokdonensis FR1436]|uniref:ABC-2 family transporter protein n=1 Tax=Nocardioides dokdonensis FR1436 TaxID=1300347 RepID=A0A1A9GNP7_9ACTN|nr:ABC transporter permease [Nocardioides dokdonensis]ANH39290.1 ABC-2 family transporter protein [Nocardioides dokdonensis FR1436]